MHSIQHLIDIAIEEDLGPGDITTDNLIGANVKGTGIIIAKQSMVVAGMDVACRVFKSIDSQVELSPMFDDGDKAKAGDVLLRIEGPLRALLHGERTALNFLQRLSGVSTHVRTYVEEIEGIDVRLTDTRKTTPGWRQLEKYAVRVGGAFNHRAALYDGVLVKDNHIAAFGSIGKAILRIRSRVSHLVKIEVEVSNSRELEEAILAEADVIMLDNMTLEQVKESVLFIDKRAIVEVSGNVTIKNLKVLAMTGVDIISSGALTHQATAVDLSMKIKGI